MNLANDRFSKSDVTFKNNETGVLTTLTQYTYETHNALYDVVVLSDDGKQKMFRTNMGAWSNMITNMKPIHYAIETHFNI